MYNQEIFESLFNINRGLDQYYYAVLLEYNYRENITRRHL